MRWLVDGMNVIGARPDGWWRDRHGAAVALVALLERWAEGTDDHVTVVFEHPPAEPIPSAVVEVAHAPRARRDSADDEIVRRARAAPEPATLRVVTSDRRLAERVRAAGASVESASAFRALIDAR